MKHSGPGAPRLGSRPSKVECVTQSHPRQLRCSPVHLRILQQLVCSSPWHQSFTRRTFEQAGACISRFVLPHLRSTRIFEHRLDNTVLGVQRPRNSSEGHFTRLSIITDNKAKKKTNKSKESNGQDVSFLLWRFLFLCARVRACVLARVPPLAKDVYSRAPRDFALQVEKNLRLPRPRSCCCCYMVNGTHPLEGSASRKGAKDPSTPEH